MDTAPQAHGGAIAAHANPHIYAFLATLALTGLRFSEAAGLLVDDVSLTRGRIYVRPNAIRRLKTKGSQRTVPLWPQLREILAEYIAERERTGGIGTLLFPSVGGRPRTAKDDPPADDGKERMIRDVRKALDAIGKRVGFAEGSLRAHMFRHTYCAQRIQTLDRGAPVAMYTVARELGHASTAMIERVYGHLHDRAEEGGTDQVSFRVEHYREKLGDRLDALQTEAAPT